MNIGEKIRWLRDSKGIKRSWLAKNTELTINYIYKIEKGLVNPSKKALKRIASALGVPLEYLLQEENIQVPKDGTLVEKPLRAIPIYGRIAAGSPRVKFDDIPIEGYLYLPDVPKDVFALKVSGDSMIGAGIEHGDIVIVYPPYYEPLNGKIVVARIDGSEFTLKRYYKEKDRIVLNPANGNYKPIVFSLEEAEYRLEIVGIAKKVVKNL